MRTLLVALAQVGIGAHMIALLWGSSAAAEPVALDLSSLWMQGEQVVRGSELSRQQAPTPTESVRFRLTEVLSGELSVGDTLELQLSEGGWPAPAQDLGPLDAFLFLVAAQPVLGASVALPSSRTLVAPLPSGVRVVSGEGIYLMLPTSGAGTSRLQPQPRDPTELWSEPAITTPASLSRFRLDLERARTMAVATRAALDQSSGSSRELALLALLPPPPRWPPPLAPARWREQRLITVQDALVDEGDLALALDVLGRDVHGRAQPRALELGQLLDLASAAEDVHRPVYQRVAALRAWGATMLGRRSALPARLLQDANLAVRYQAARMLTLKAPLLARAAVETDPHVLCAIYQGLTASGRSSMLRALRGPRRFNLGVVPPTVAVDAAELALGYRLLASSALAGSRWSLRATAGRSRAEWRGTVPAKLEVGAATLHFSPPLPAGPQRLELTVVLSRGGVVLDELELSPVDVSVTAVQ